MEFYDEDLIDVSHIQIFMVPRCLLLRGALQGPIWPSGGGVMNPVLALLRLPRKMHLCRSSSNVPTPAIVFRNATKTLTSCSHLTRCTIPCACHAKRDLNVQKWFVHGVLWAFWLRNVLRSIMACTFSTSQLSKVLRTWDVFCFFTCKMCFAPQRRALFHLSSGQMAAHPLL